MYRDFASTWAYSLLAHLSNGDLGGADPSRFLDDRIHLSQLATAEYLALQGRPQNAGHVSPKPASPTNSRLLNGLLKGLWRLIPGSSQSFDHFLRAFAAETVLEGRFGSSTAAQLSHRLAPYLALDRDRDAGDPRGRFHRVFLEAAPVRRFFLLRNGTYACMGPTVIREGDVVAALFGGTVPYALRLVDDDGGGRKYYMLLGECYVYGIMNGEYEGKMRRRFGDLAAAAEIFPLR
ncbi:hypothetical protein V8F33_012988 [Rhypophila sp. PSN 637]